LLRAPRKWISYSAWWTAAYGIVILDFANCKYPAGAGAGVYALLSYAGKRSGAVRVLQALSPATLVRGRVSLVSSSAAAHYLPRPVLITLCVWPAWRWVTRILRSAALERVSAKSWVASTILSDISDEALRIVSAWSRLTQSQDWLVDRDTALDSVDRLCEAWLAGTPLHIIHHHTLSVGSAWVWLTLLHRLHTWNSRGVSFKSWQAVADRTVSNHSAPRVWSALVSTAFLSIFDTSYKWVASLSSRTGADWVSIIQLTKSIRAARRGHTRVGGWLVEGAPNIRVAIKSRFAGAYWVVVDISTLCVVPAETRAHRQTLSVEPVAVLVLWAVRIYGALFEAISIRRIANSGVDIGDFYTFTVFASKTWQTVASSATFTSRDVNAASLMVGNLAVLSCSALTQPTWIDTLFVLASLLGGTFTATSTPNTLDTTIVSIGGETRGAEFTNSFVVLDNTRGVPRTCGAFTRVLALVPDTGLASRAASVLQAD
jgi:hypothetical protein